MKKKSILLISCLVIAVLFSACAGTDSGDAKQIKAVFADAGWDSIRFHNAVASFIGGAAYNIAGRRYSRYYAYYL